MTRSIDRRTARTHKALHEALMTLILKKGYEAITVQDIIDEADVGRSTFYAHYTGKDDLLRSGFDELRTLLADEERRIASANAAATEPLAFSLALFRHACDYKQVYRALVGGGGGALAVNEIRRVLGEVVRRELADAPDEAIPQELRVEFVVAAFVTVLSWSLGRRPIPPPERMNAMFRRLVIDGLGVSVAAVQPASGAGVR